MKCEYCGKADNQKDSVKCGGCGALLNNVIEPKEYRNGPGFYNGYIVYFIHNPFRMSRRVQFWLGVNLIETIEVHDEVLREFVPEQEDPMPYIWKLFELAQGKEEVLKVQERNKEYPATFEVRRIENSEMARMKQEFREKVRT